MAELRFKFGPSPSSYSSTATLYLFFTLMNFFFSLNQRPENNKNYFLQLYHEHLEGKDHFQRFLIIQILFDEWMKEGGKEGGKEEWKEEKGGKEQRRGMRGVLMLLT